MESIKTKQNAIILYIGNKYEDLVSDELDNHSALDFVQLTAPSNLTEFLLNTIPDVILLEYDESFNDFISYISFVKRSTEAPVIVLLPRLKCSFMVQIIKNGADNLICEPFTEEVLMEGVFEALKMRLLWREVHDLKNVQRTSMGRIIGSAPSMQILYNIIENVYKTDATVFIEGQSGTGKELVAQAIHDNGARNQKEFVALNCGAIPPNLLESELFGHERGAFTGAIKSRKGKFEQATGGTLFLDEICELPIDLQVKLLRVIQEMKVTRVGGEKEIPVDTRIICATNKNVFNEVKEGRFREDLYYRLNVVPVKIPSLTERRQDIPLLCAHFLHIFIEKYNKYFYEFSPPALRRLCSYDWPGNVRELENILERIVVLNDGSVVEESFLPDEILNSPVMDYITSPDHLRIDKKRLLHAKPIWKVEIEMIKAAMSETEGDVIAASKILEIGQASLYRKLKIYGIERSSFINKENHS